MSTIVKVETNLRASYAAGRYKQLTDPGLLKRRPYWQYVHSGHSNPRKEHKAWGDAKLTLPHGHPFWETHYPPNGWGCGCTVRAVRAPEEGASSEAPGGWDTPDPKTGEPPGIDKGWGYAPGANTDTSLRQMVQDKLITYPPAIQRALISDIGRQLNVVDRIEDYVDAVCADAARKDDLWLGFVERPERFRDVAKTPLNQFLVLLPPTVARHIKKAHGHDGKDQRMATPADLHLLMRGLNEGEAVPGEYNKGLGHERFIVRWDEGTEQLRAVWEVRQGRHNRAVALISLIVKRKK